MNELIPLENISAVQVFSENGLDDLLEKITSEVNSHVPDTETDKGRKAIASLSAKVSKSKTYLDGLGKELVSDWKSKSKLVDGERKKMRDTLDMLKAKARKPLTDYEDEKERIYQIIQSEINELIEIGRETAEEYLTAPVDVMRNRLEEIKSKTDPLDLYEYQDRYNEVKADAITKITKSISLREKHDTDQAELEVLRKEKEARDEKDRIAQEELDQAEHDKQIAKDAEAKAKSEAEENTRRIENEKDAAIAEGERLKREASDEKGRAKRREEAARVQAKVDAENAVKAERERADREKAADAAAQKKREANKAHKKKINNQAVKGFVTSGLTEDDAKKAVTAIAMKLIKNVVIKY